MTDYRIAKKAMDYEECYNLMREEGVPDSVSVGFPTLIASEEGKIIGFCATNVVDNMVVAGPLLLRSDRRRAFTALELCVRYEEELRRIGIVSYIFSAERGGIMEEAVKRYMHGMEPYAEDDTHKYYIRRLTQDQASPVQEIVGVK